MPVVGAGGDRLAGLRAVPHPELFLEARALQHQLAARVGDHRLAVEQQPVVAAHHVHVHHRHARASADARQEPAPHPRLAAVVGRGGGRHQQGRALVQAVAHRVHGVAAGGVGLGLPPDVLADGEPDALALEVDDAAFGGRLEVARLVEHVVGGQQSLGLRVQDAAAGEQAGGVGQVLAGGAAVAVHVADHRAEAGRHGVLQVAQRLAVLCHERFVVEQVHRRVAAQAQLREHHQVGVQAARLLQPGDNAGAVAGEIADGGVDLGEGDAHGSITPETTRTSDLRFRKPVLYPTELLGRVLVLHP